MLQLLGGRYVNISHDTIAREEMERIKAEEWIGVLQDGGNQVHNRELRRLLLPYYCHLLARPHPYLFSV
jgi:hypothetical protein